MSRSFPIHLIYASTSGNVELVVQHVAKILEQQGWKTQLHRAEQTSIEILNDNPTFVIATSTWEHGALNPFFQKLFDQMKEAHFDNKRAAFIGLGDRRYEPVLFCEGMEKVRRVWMSNGGAEVMQALKINGEPYALLGEVVTPWATKLSVTLNNGNDSSPSLLQSIKNLLDHD